MKNLAFLGLLVALAVLWYVLSRGSTESFVPEFLDQGNVKSTTRTRASSYAQDTNHFHMTPSPQEPVPGVPTPFRVNMYNSHME